MAPVSLSSSEEEGVDQRAILEQLQVFEVVHGLAPGDSGMRVLSQERFQYEVLAVYLSFQLSLRYVLHLVQVDCLLFLWQLWPLWMDLSLGMCWPVRWLLLRVPRRGHLLGPWGLFGWQ